MKAGLTTSALAHVAVLAFGIVSLAAPKQLEVPDIEALPIDIVPYEELTKSIAGAKKADPSTKPTPRPTRTVRLEEPAVNVGDTDKDIKADAPKDNKQPPKEKVEAPAAEPDPTPPKPKTPVPTPDLAPEPKPKTDIALLLKQNQPDEAETPEEESPIVLPKRVSVPKKRPKRPKAETAQTNKRKDEVKPTETTKAKAEESKESDATKKAVLDKAKTSAGGAKRSTEQASLGTKKSNNATKLSQNEMDALRSALEGCFNAGDLPGHQDAANMRARVTFKLTLAGEIEGLVRAKVTGTSGATRAVFSRRVKNAVKECAPYKLPADKYDTWADVVVNFSLTDLL
ncbi:MAG: hypothetical protein GKR97_01375 [Rhizobiaceae bacterium]|nr:hypothetical protein [Rhizobiaceae bacterium]